MCSATLLSRLESCASEAVFSYGISKEGVGPDGTRVWCSPLVLDLNGESRVTRPDGRWHFDLTANSSSEHMNWMGEGDALFARNVDGCGCLASIGHPDIDSGFGEVAGVARD